MATAMMVYANKPNTNTTNAHWALQNDPRFNARISEMLAKNVLQLSQEIGTTILQDSDRPTEVISPLSIYMALSILLMGSNGPTFYELMHILKINDSDLLQSTWKVHEELSLMIDDLNRDIPHPGRRRHQTEWKAQETPVNIYDTSVPTEQQISIANGIFFQNGYSIRPDYQNAMESIYKSTLQRLDFASKPDLSTKFINRWVADKTQEKIMNILSETVPPNTRAIMASALYFKALWEKSFIDRATRSQEFYPDGKSRPAIMVETMSHGGSFPFYDSKEYDCRIIGLPYRHHLTTMYIIMPNDSTRHRLRQFQATLTADKIEQMISRMEWRTAIITVPKLHITNRVDLKSILKRMGLRSLFNAQQSDLSLISNGMEQPINMNDHQYESNAAFAPASVGEDRFLFSRLAAESELEISAENRKRRSTVTYKASSTNFRTIREPLRLKDLVLGKRITKSYPNKKIISRGRRDIPFNSSISLKRLDMLRSRLTVERAPNPGLFADELIHQIDLIINEAGTEGAAVTLTTLRRSQQDVLFKTETPFLFLIRHEETKLPIFYGAVFEPTN